jgi:hypothetical protein
VFLDPALVFTTGAAARLQHSEPSATDATDATAERAAVSEPEQGPVAVAAVPGVAAEVPASESAGMHAPMLLALH